MGFQQEALAFLIKTAGEILGVDPAGLSAETRINEDLNMKSSEIVRLTSMLENEYDVEVPFMAFRRNKTLGEAAKYMAEITGY